MKLCATRFGQIVPSLADPIKKYCEIERTSLVLGTDRTYVHTMKQWSNEAPCLDIRLVWPTQRKGEINQAPMKTITIYLNNVTAMNYICTSDIMPRKKRWAPFWLKATWLIETCAKLPESVFPSVSLALMMEHVLVDRYVNWVRFRNGNREVLFNCHGVWLLDNVRYLGINNIPCCKLPNNSTAI